MNLYRAVRPALFTLPAETAHGIAKAGLAAIQGTPLEGALAAHYAVRDDRLAVDAFGRRFPNPVGVAAGFDKNGRIPSALAGLGFGHVEIGGVTAEAQPGNPRPRLFRLPGDRALINRMGFNNEGADAVAAHLAATAPGVPLGVNIGKSKSTPIERAEEDYAYTYERLAEHGDFFVVNVSSPNTPGLRELQHREPLERILAALQDAGAEPLLVKLSPDLSRGAVEDAIDLARERGLDGLVAANTTTERPDGLSDPDREEEGGLSGAPLAGRATDLVRFVAERTECPVIGVGGVFTAEDAYRKIRAGASLVQLYTGLVYRGPSIAKRINRGLLALLERDGFGSVGDAVGANLD
ncbi:MAG: quinone-dependent dihydroorotate dehydrogenase [Halobacteriales archaeon]